MPLPCFALNSKCQTFNPESFKNQISYKNMISPKKLIKIARKWQEQAALKRKRISLPRLSNSSVAEKGHFVLYTADQSRFMFPISYLNNYLFQELLNMSEEEFGLPSNGPITLPFDSIFLEYAVLLIQGCVDRNLEEALLMFIASTKYSSLSHNSFHQDHTNSQQLLACSC